MKKADESFVIIGKIGSPYGISGWLKIHTYTEFDASILDYQPWYLSVNQHDWRAVRVEEGRMQNQRVLAKLEGINVPESAKLLTGNFIAVRREQLPSLKKDEYYWSDLIGLNVINKDGTQLGKVIYLMETGSNDVLIIKGEKEHAIPYLYGKVVLNVDLDQQVIQVDWELI